MWSSATENYSAAAFRADLEPVRVLEQKTRAREIAPLVLPGQTSFWARFFMEFLCARARRAIRRQLRLRVRLRAAEHVPVSPGMEHVRVLLGGIFATEKELLLQVMPEDEIPAVISFADDDWGFITFFRELEKLRGSDLSDEEIERISHSTIGTLADILEDGNANAAEGSE